MGVRIAVEVIPNALSTARQLVRLIEDEDLPALGICLDVGHARLQGDVVDALETVAGYLVTTHLHDNGGRKDDHLLPFDGVIDWAELLIAFQKVGYDGTLMLELAAAADGAAATLRRAGGGAPTPGVDAGRHRLQLHRGLGRAVVQRGPMQAGLGEPALIFSASYFLFSCDPVCPDRCRPSPTFRTSPSSTARTSPCGGGCTIAAPAGRSTSSSSATAPGSSRW